jgi:hypothetical protein
MARFVASGIFLDWVPKIADLPEAFSPGTFRPKDNSLGTLAS